MANITRRRNEEFAPLSVDPFRMMREMLNFDPFREIEPVYGAVEMFNPRFDVKETKEGYIFKADLPGIDEKDLDVTMTGNRLTISGKREAEKKEEGANFYAFERQFGSFSRSFTLPEGVDPDHINAELKGGVLTLTLPKKPEHQPRKISVSSIAEKVKGVFGKEGGKA